MANGPIDYTFKGIRDPFQQTMQGYQVGAAAAEQENQRKLAELQQQKMQIAQEDLNKLSALENPTSKDYARVITRHPQFAEQLNKTWSMLEPERQQSLISHASQVYSALSNNQPEIAKQLLDQQAQAARNAGDEQGAKHAETMSKLIDVDPRYAKDTTGLSLASLMGPKEFANTMSKLGSEERERELQASKLTKSQAEATRAAVAANYAESNAVADLEKKGWDIDALANDIDVKKANVKIAALNAKLKVETNKLKRDELLQKITDAQMARERTVNDMTGKIESARFSIDNMLNTIDGVLKTPMDVVEAATGPISTRLPTLSEDTANFEEAIATIDAQAFLAQVPLMTGKGALSDAEGKKLSAALQNLSLRQGASKLISNLREAQRLMLKARKNIADMYGVPETTPDTPQATPTNEQMDELLRKYNIEPAARPELSAAAGPVMPSPPGQ